MKPIAALLSVLILANIAVAATHRYAADQARIAALEAQIHQQQALTADLTQTQYDQNRAKVWRATHGPGVQEEVNHSYTAQIAFERASSGDPAAYDRQLRADAKTESDVATYGPVACAAAYAQQYKADKYRATALRRLGYR